MENPSFFHGVLGSKKKKGTIVYYCFNGSAVRFQGVIYSPNLIHRFTPLARKVQIQRHPAESPVHPRRSEIPKRLEKNGWNKKKQGVGLTGPQPVKFFGMHKWHDNNKHKIKINSQTKLKLTILYNYISRMGNLTKLSLVKRKKKRTRPPSGIGEILLWTQDIYLDRISFV